MVLEQGASYGRSAIGKGEAVNVEYISANPTGPMHVGHCRGAVFGDALANLLDFTGFAVTREYYVNDAGAQVDALARSAFLRYREALGEKIGEIPEGLYPGDYLKPVGAKLADQHGNELLAMTESEWLPIVRAAALQAMIAMIENDLGALGIRHDVFFSERSLSEGPRDEVAETINDLKATGPHLSRTAAAAQGQGRRGLGGPRAASVPLDRVRRRHRPAAGEVRRLLRLFRRRHRLSPRQVQTRL